MKIRSVVVASVVALAGVVVPMSATSAATGVTIKGTAAGAAKILVLTGSGRAYKADVAASGAFSVSGVPAASVKNSTLQFVDATGKYLGPAVLKVVKSGKNWKAVLGLKAQAKGTLNVGVLKNQTGWFKAVKTIAAGSAGVTAIDKSGKPKGAGLAGRVKLVTASVATMATLRKLAATKCPDGSPKDANLNGTEQGQDLDCDSVPNSIDVDDNGNGSLDILDQKTNDSDDKDNYTASIATYSDMNAPMTAKLNIHAADAATILKQVKSILGADADTSIGGRFQIAVFLGEQNIARPLGGSPTEVWVECPGIKWCDAATGTAIVHANSEMQANRADVEGKKWNTFASTDFTSGKGVAGTTGKSNGFYKFGEVANGNSRWAVFMSPNYSGDDVLSVVRANDVIVMHGMVNGADVNFPITISPFFVTTPYIKSITATGVDALNTKANIESGYFAIGEDGKLGLSFWRPQRMLLEGETGETVNPSFKSQHGLHYGLVPTSGYVNGKSIAGNEVELGCGGSDAPKVYTGLSAGLEAQTQAYGKETEDPATDFWPVFDNTADDSADSEMSLTFDWKTCLTTHKPANFGPNNRASLAGKTISQLLGYTWEEFIGDARAYQDFSLTGVGSPSTNGYNRSVLTFRLYSPKWNGQPPSQNNNSGSSNNSGSNNSSGSSNNSGSNNSSGSSSGSGSSNSSGSGSNSGSNNSSGGSNKFSFKVVISADSDATVSMTGLGGCDNRQRGESCTGEATTGGTVVLASSGSKLELVSQTSSAVCSATDQKTITCRPSAADQNVTVKALSN